MKKIVLIVSLILLFFFFTPEVESKQCYVPPRSCPSGYLCYDILENIYPHGRKQGWERWDFFETNSGSGKYMIRVIWDIGLYSFYTGRSKVLYTGIHKVSATPVTEVTELSSSLDFNASDPGPAYLFGPGPGSYEDCGILWIDLTQTDKVNLAVYFEHKTYILDFNEDGWVDIYDAIILSNEFGNSWGSPGDSVDPNDYTWRADVNSDGEVNTLDAVILKNQFDTEYIKPELVGSWKWEPEWPS